MSKKEITDKNDLFAVLNIMDRLNMRYWIDGGWYEFDPDFFTNAAFEGRTILCISAKAQKLFHTGYELREVDRIDLNNLERLLEQ